MDIETNQSLKTDDIHNRYEKSDSSKENFQNNVEMKEDSNNIKQIVLNLGQNSGEYIEPNLNKKESNHKNKSIENNMLENRENHNHEEYQSIVPSPKGVNSIKQTKDPMEIEKEQSLSNSGSNAQTLEINEGKIAIQPDENSNEEDISDVQNNKLDRKRNLNEINSDGKYKIRNKLLSKSELQERYKCIIYRNPDDVEVTCTICLEDEAFSDDEIVLCDLCNASFHQSCYGSDLLNLQPNDDSEWFCQRCSYLLGNDLPYQNIACEFCPEMKGVMKKIKEDSTKHWAHMICVNYIPEIYYLDEKTKINVKIEEYWAHNSCERKSLVCDFCKIKYGDCIQCDNDKCLAAFHATCAQMHGIICCWKDMVGLKRENDEEYYFPVYCKKHMKAFNKDMYNLSEEVEDRNQKRLEDLSYLMKNLASKSKEKSSVIKSAKKESRPKKKQTESVETLIVEEKEKKKREIKRENLDSKYNLRTFSSSQSPDKGEKNSGKEEESQNSEEDKNKKLSPSKQAGPKALRIKAKKSASFYQEEGEEGKSKNEEKDRKERSKVYKFVPEMADLMGVASWAEEKEIKKVIQIFIKNNNLYDKETDKLILDRLPKLKEMFGITEIPRPEIFSKFMIFMIKKSRHHKEKEKQNEADEKDPGHIKRKKIKLDENHNGKTAKEEEKKGSVELPPAIVSSPIAKDKKQNENKENSSNLTKQGKELVKESGKDSDKLGLQRRKSTDAPPKLEKRKSEQTENSKNHAKIGNEAGTHPEKIVLQRRTSTEASVKHDKKKGELVENSIKSSKHEGQGSTLSEKLALQRKMSVEAPPKIEKRKSEQVEYNPFKHTSDALTNNDKIPLQRKMSTDLPPKLEKKKSEQTGEDKKNAHDDPKLKKPVNHNNGSNNNTNEKKKEVPKPKLQKNDDINLSAASFMKNFLGTENVLVPEKKVNKENKQERLGGLSTLINRSDQIPFRKNMSWFTRMEIMQEVESISYSETLTSLWPKGAEMLF